MCGRSAFGRYGACVLDEVVGRGRSEGALWKTNGKRRGVWAASSWRRERGRVSPPPWGVAGGDEPSNKLFEELGASTVLGTTIDSVPPCYDVVVSTRWPAAAMVAEQHGARFALHCGPQRSDSVRAGLGEGLGRDWQGCLFLPGDQPLVSRESFERLAEALWRGPQYIHRLGWKGHPGSPVLFPARCFSDLMKLVGTDGGSAILRREGLPVKIVDAVSKIELLDIDVPDDLDVARAQLSGAVVLERESKEGRAS